MLGSPNLTARADCDTQEVAVCLRTVYFRGRDDVSTAVYKLIQYAQSIIGEDDVRLSTTP